MALPTSQPVPEILRGWTVTIGIPTDVTDGINSGIYELYGGGIPIAAGRIIRHRIPPREPNPIVLPVVDDPLLRAIGTQPQGGSQPGNCQDRAGNPSRCCPDSRRIRRPAGRLETKHRLKEAGTLPRSPRADSQRRHLANLTALGGTCSMRTHSLMPVLECENDMVGRFTKSPHYDSHRPCRSCLVFSSAYASAPGSPSAERAISRGSGSRDGGEL